jgi:hypothetical protein
VIERNPCGRARISIQLSPRLLTSIPDQPGTTSCTDTNGTWPGPFLCQAGAQLSGPNQSRVSDWIAKFSQQEMRRFCQAKRRQSTGRERACKGSAFCADHPRSYENEFE